MCSMPNRSSARPHLRQALPVDLAARLGRVEIMAAPIGVEAARQAVLAEHLEQRPKGRRRAFLLDQERRVDRARRIVHRHDQVERRLTLEPRRPRAVLMQHHARTRLALALATVRSAPWRARHQPRPMQLRLHPGVAPAEPVIAPQMLVKMLHVPAPIRLPVQPQHPSLLPRRHPLRRRLAQPAVAQPLQPVLLVAIPVAPELTLRNAQQLPSLQHRQRPRFPAAQHIQKLLHPAVL